MGVHFQQHTDSNQNSRKSLWSNRISCHCLAKLFGKSFVLTWAAQDLAGSLNLRRWESQLAETVSSATTADAGSGLTAAIFNVYLGEHRQHRTTFKHQIRVDQVNVQTKPNPFSMFIWSTAPHKHSISSSRFDKLQKLKKKFCLSFNYSLYFMTILAKQVTKVINC